MRLLTRTTIYFLTVMLTLTGVGAFFLYHAFSKALDKKTDEELIGYKNFGKKSLDEIKERLTELSLSLGMDVAAASAQPKAS